MSLILVAAIGNNGELGLNGRLPWHCPGELEHFRRTVADMVTVCGVRTFPTLPKFLRKRTFVWSGRGWDGVGATYNTDQILSVAAYRDVAIIGGARTYAEFMPYADKMILSVIQGEFEADVWFPIITQKWGWPSEILPETMCHSSGHVYEVCQLVKKVRRT